jgi:hypothetical protein
MPGRYQPNKTALALEEDLEMLIAGWCRKDDVAILRKPPSREHLAELKRAGFDLPEIVSPAELKDRKLGGLRPWAWSADASELLKPLAGQMSGRVPWKWREPLPARWFSKEIGIALEELLEIGSESGTICRSVEEAMEAIAAHLDHGQALAKAAYSHAGRGHKRINADSPEEQTRNWLKNTLADHGCVVIEPWLERVTDFSALYEMGADGAVELIGLTVMENDAAGRFLGSRVSPKWASMLDPEVAAFLHRDARVMEWYQEKIPEELGRLLPGYVGPLGVDAMVHRRADGSLALKHVVELNVRMTMGRIALELLKKSAPNRNGRLRILRKGKTADPELLGGGTLQGGSVLLNDPATAREFLALWEVSVRTEES